MDGTGTLWCQGSLVVSVVPQEVEEVSWWCIKGKYSVCRCQTMALTDRGDNTSSGEVDHGILPFLEIQHENGSNW